MIRRRGWDVGRVGRVACLALVSAFLPELSLLRLRGLDGCSCQVRMALSICRRVESLMPRAEGRRHETLAVDRPRAGTPAASETAAAHPRAQLAARQADRCRYRSTAVYHVQSRGRGLHNDRPGRYSLSPAGVGYRGLVIGDVELSSP